MRVIIENEHWTEVFEESCFEGRPHFITFISEEDKWVREGDKYFRYIKKCKFYPPAKENVSIWVRIKNWFTP